MASSPKSSDEVEPTELSLFIMGRRYRGRFGPIAEVLYPHDGKPVVGNDENLVLTILLSSFRHVV